MVSTSAGGRSTSVTIAASRPRLSTSCRPTSKELNWPCCGFGFTVRNAAWESAIGAKLGAFAPATTITSSVAGCRARIAAERNVPSRQGRSALSRPMREDAPAARITPANEGERAMDRTISYLEVEEIVYGASAVDHIEIAKTAKIAKNRRGIGVGIR